MTEERSIMNKMQSAAEEYFSGPIPEGNAYSGDNIRKNYRTIQRAAAEWGAKWIAKEAGVKTYNPSPSDQFLSYLDEEINDPNISYTTKLALISAKGKFQSLLNKQSIHS